MKKYLISLLLTTFLTYNFAICQEYQKIDLLNYVCKIISSDEFGSHVDYELFNSSEYIMVVDHSPNIEESCSSNEITCNGKQLILCKWKNYFFQDSINVAFYIFRFKQNKKKTKIELCNFERIHTAQSVCYEKYIFSNIDCTVLSHSRRKKKIDFMKD